MAANDGFAFRWRDIYALSLFTRVNTKGEQSVYVQSPSGETHAHGWVPPNASGETIGCSMKRLGDTGEHAIGDVFARAVLQCDAEGEVKIQLAAVGPSSVISSVMIPQTRTTAKSSRSWIDLQRDEEKGLELAFSYVAAGYSSRGSDEIILPWATTLPGVFLCQITALPSTTAAQP